MLGFSVIVAVLFAAFIALDAISLFPRKAGASLEKNALGYSFLVMINTLKRVFIVLYPPALGLLAMHSGMTAFPKAIAIAHVLGVVSLACVYLLRNQVIAFFTGFITLYSSGHRLHRAALIALRMVAPGVAPKNRLELPVHNIRARIALPAIFIFFFYSASGFIINIFAVAFADYASFILQLIGIINAFGTLMMAFVLDPMISKTFEDGDPENIVMPSLFFAQAVNIAILSPVILIPMALFLS